MKLIVGLGNPGKEYLQTRHNIGFMVLDRLAQQLGGEFCDLSRWEAATLELTVGGEKVVLLKPLTFMNNSGRSVGKFAAYYKIEPQDVWVISDDIDLPLGRIRLRDTGSSGGHNGLKSINSALGTEDYWHIRLGVGQMVGNEGDSPTLEPEASVFVLQAFEVKEQKHLQKIVDYTAQLIQDGLQTKTLENHTHEVDAAG